MDPKTCKPARLHLELLFLATLATAVTACSTSASEGDAADDPADAPPAQSPADPEPTPDSTPPTEEPPPGPTHPEPVDPGLPPEVACGDRECGPNPEGPGFCGRCAAGQGCDGDGRCGAWPPDIDSLYSLTDGCLRPVCDRTADPGYDFDGGAERGWVKEMRTVWTDCPEAVGGFDPRAAMGAINYEHTGVPTDGSCVYDGELGTAYEGVVAWCGSWPAGVLDVMINYRAVIDHVHESPARGVGLVHVTNLPGAFFRGQTECFVEMEVIYRKCPEESDC